MSKKNPTFIVFSDQHLGAKLYNTQALEDDNRMLFRKVIDFAIELKVDYLISCGDLFDNNKPTSELIDFVSSELSRLKNSGVMPLAIAGDHSAPVDNITWEKICGFYPISSVPSFVGVDYCSDPERVLADLNDQLARKKPNTVQHIFLHQQIPELWPFCDDKKKIALSDIDLSNHCDSIQCIFLGDIHIRREMSYFNIPCDKNIFVGYCGSLGVTASDETDKEGLYYWDGEKLQLVEYSLPREYVVLKVDEEFMETLNVSDFDKYKGSENKPVFICRKDKAVSDIGKLNFLYDIGFVFFSRLNNDKSGSQETVNIRSELKTSDRISDVLKQLSANEKNSKLVYQYAYDLVNSDDPRMVLDKLKKEYEEKLQDL